MMRNFFTVLAAGAGLLAAAPSQADSGVWMLQGASNRVYIAGSIHLLRPESSSLPPALARAYGDAERLVLELDLDDVDQMQLAADMMRTGTRSDGKTLSATLPAPLAARLARDAGELGLPMALLESMEPWLASLMLTSASLIKHGFSPDAGIDQQLANLAKQDGKPVTGLETPAEQFAVFDRLAPQAQIHLLDLTLDEAKGMDQQLAEIESAWRAGDQAKLTHQLQDDMAGFPELETALLTTRNRRWLPAIQALLTGKDDVLVVVGAAHLLGDKGVIALLRASGRTPLPVAAQ